MAKDVTLTIDGTTVTVPAGTLLVEAAKSIRTDVPVYCYHPKLGPAGLCRICLVEVEKTPKLQIGCNTAVAEGMVVRTCGAKVEEGRRAVMEFLLVNHPLDCPICDKGGECDLQDFSMAYGQSASRLADPKSSKPKAVDLGPTIVLDDERCIVCQRCSRFDEIITNERSLVVMDRGQRDVIATASGRPYVSQFSGNVTELCPVGALTSKTYRFKSRPWDNRRTQTACLQCSTGCGLNVDERYGSVQRTMSVPDDPLSDGWLCDRGRYNVAFYDDPRRLVSPMLRRGSDFVQIGWDDAIGLWAERLREALDAGGPRAAGAIGGGRLLNEEIVLLERVMRGLGIANLDWRAGRQRRASLGPRGGTYAELESAQLIVALGRPPSQTAPVLDLRVRKAVQRFGARYVTVGPHAAKAFVPALNLPRLDALAPYLEGVRRVAFVWDGIDDRVGAEADALMESLASRGVAVAAFVTGEQSNARGAEAFGLLPRDGGLDSAGMFATALRGELRTLALFGVNPVLHHPLGGDAVRAALERVPFVVASELFPTETVSLAHLVLPARGPFEKSGHAYGLAGDVLAVHAAHTPPDGTLSDGEMLVALAAALGLDVPAPDELAALASAPPPASAPRVPTAALDTSRGRPERRSRPGCDWRLQATFSPAAGRSGSTSVWRSCGRCPAPPWRRGRPRKRGSGPATRSTWPRVRACCRAWSSGSTTRFRPASSASSTGYRRLRRMRSATVTSCASRACGRPKRNVPGEACADVDVLNAAPWWLVALLKSAIILFVILTVFAYSMLFERKIMGWMQLRPGPNRVGPWGLLQPAADAAKMLFKEDLTPDSADPLIYRFAPFISLVCAMGAFAVIPFSESSSGLWGISDVNAGILVIFAITSIGVYGISLAGWSSGSKYPLLGSVRSTAQMISYELAMTMSVIGVLIIAGTTSLAGIVHAQNRVWFVLPQLVGFIVYLVTAVAETNRAPFDLVEAETELVGGFHTEYSGLRFGLFFIAEYLNMITVSCIATLLFLGGWNAPFGLTIVPGIVWFVLKAGLFIFMYIWLRTTLPRLRYDRLMNFGWKVLLPVATLNLMITAAIVAVMG